MKFFIGQKIEHGPAYPMECWERFETVFNKDLSESERNSSPTPLFLSGVSFVVGLRMAIVEDYKYKPERKRGGFFEAVEYVPASSSGKREECLVCTRSMKPFRPYLVRKKDVKNEISPVGPS
jgi:hypothetical protein